METLKAMPNFVLLMMATVREDMLSKHRWFLPPSINQMTAREDDLNIILPLEDPTTNFNGSMSAKKGPGKHPTTLKPTKNLSPYLLHQLAIKQEVVY